MEIQDLKNYGKSSPEITRELPSKVNSKIMKITMGIIQKYLGAEKMNDFLNQNLKELKRLNEKDLTEIRAFCKDEEFIKGIIRYSALYCALNRFVEEKEALDIQFEVMDNIMPIVAKEAYPLPEDILSFEAPLEALKKYIIAQMEADQKEGVHFYETVEDAENVFQFNIKRCAFYEIPKFLGIPKLCSVYCYSDDVIFPELSKKLGLKFIRTGSIARGNEICYFRFERI